MDDDREQRLGVGDNPAEFSSSWPTLGHDSSDSVYFFGDDRESSILGEFGWSLHGPALPPRSAELLPIGADSAGIAEPSTTAGGSRGGPAALEASTTSNHPSVSSDSSEDPAEKSTGSGGNPQPAETPSKVRKKGQKRIRQARFAFMTKSEVDHLEDGYRWRKYGQKAVKNSPFPSCSSKDDACMIASCNLRELFTNSLSSYLRAFVSYYRCTNSKCTVKKRVERSSEDPTFVITTYEGQHCHHSVGFPRGGSGLLSPSDTAAAFGGQQIAPPLVPQLYNPQRDLNLNPSPRETNSPYRPPNLPLCPVPAASSGSDPHRLPTLSSSDQPQAQQLGTTNPRGITTDEGLLGDIVPSSMRHK